MNTPNLVTKNDILEAPCLLQQPWKTTGQKIIHELRTLDNTELSSIFRTWITVYFKSEIKKVLLSDENPISATEKVLKNILSLIPPIHSLSSLSIISPPLSKIESSCTYDHFGTLFSTNATKSFWEQPYHQLKIRLERNHIDLDIFKDATIVDIGCGSGRNSFVLKDLGAKKVIGIDISEAGIQLANQRKEELGIGNEIEFLVGSAMDLPFHEHEFDIAFSMGVFHHTPNWKKCINEMYRIMKPSGVGLLMYLNEKPGGILYDHIDFLRCILLNDNPKTIQKSLELLGIDNSDIIGILDPLLCEINEKLLSSDIESHLTSLNAQDIKRFERGSDYDSIEKIYNNEPFAEAKYGVGEHRYYFRK
jgi:ubiquinone/menaquinone biosynthesis C-methylase UbiE